MTDTDRWWDSDAQKWVYPSERVDLDGLRMMVKNPHAYPIVMLTQGLEYCIAELENLRTTTAEDALYIKRMEEDRDYDNEHNDRL